MKDFENMTYEEFFKIAGDLENDEFFNILAKIIENRLVTIANQIQELGNFISDCGGESTALFDVYQSGRNRMDLLDIVWTLEELKATTFLEEDEEE